MAVTLNDMHITYRVFLLITVFKGESKLKRNKRRNKIKEKEINEKIVFLDFILNNTKEMDDTGINNKCVCDSSPEHKHKKKIWMFKLIRKRYFENWAQPYLELVKKQK